MGERSQTYAGWADQLAAADVPVPGPFAEVVEVIEAVDSYRTADPVRRLRDRAANDLTAADVPEAMRTAAIESAAVDGLRAVLSPLDRALAQRAHDALLAGLPAIEKAARKRFDRAAAELVKAIEPFEVDDDELSVLRRGGPDLAAKLDVLPALVARLDTLHHLLARADQLAHRTTPPALLVTAGVDSRQRLEEATELLARVSEAPGGKWHDLHAAGFTLHASDEDTAAAAVAAVEADDQRLAERAEKLSAGTWA